jgi:hypothetical protein
VGDKNHKTCSSLGNIEILASKINCYLHLDNRDWSGKVTGIDHQGSWGLVGQKTPHFVELKHLSTLLPLGSFHEFLSRRLLSIGWLLCVAKEGARYSTLIFTSLAELDAMSDSST